MVKLKLCYRAWTHAIFMNIVFFFIILVTSVFSSRIVGLIRNSVGHGRSAEFLEWPFFRKCIDKVFMLSTRTGGLIELATWNTPKLCKILESFAWCTWKFGQKLLIGYMGIKVRVIIWTISMYISIIKLWSSGFYSKPCTLKSYNSFRTERKG